MISMYALYLRNGNRVVVGTMTAASQSSQSQSVSLTWVKRVGLGGWGCCLVQASSRACFETAQIERRGELTKTERERERESQRASYNY